jgi:tetratricopeptide (TPR) repeat protein
VSDDKIDEDRQALAEERDFYLRSLRDLDTELAAGDIDPADYRSLKEAYTARAASTLRALASIDDRGAIPSSNGNGSTHDQVPTNSASNDRRTGQAISSAGASWRRRVAVGIAVVMIAAGASWAVVASSATRLPGEEITGKALGSQAIAQELSKAAQAEERGDQLSAVKDYQTVLGADPNQPEALTGEGWLLAQTQQPSLLRQGLMMLESAEKVAPDYAPAHVYRGIALLSEGDYSGAVPELQWYLNHNPDPQLVPRVTQALQNAQSKAAQEGR